MLLYIIYCLKSRRRDMKRGGKFVGVIGLVALFGVLISSSVLAADLAVTGKLGTLGLGGSVTKNIVPNIN